MTFAEYFHCDEPDGARQLEKKLQNTAATARSAIYKAENLRKVSLLVAKKATEHALCAGLKRPYGLKKMIGE